MKLAVTIFFFLLPYMSQAQGSKTKYQCTPCGGDCDKYTYNKAGDCPHCHMKLVKQTTVEYKTIQPSEICEYIKQHKDAVLLDVRTKEEFEGTKYPEHGTIRNAINIPIQDLESRLDELAAYKDRELIVYCSHSKRSPRASYFLMQKGFSNVTNLEGGMSVMKDDDCVQRK
jgi:rhodanese-related sulfurtransferase